MKPSSSSSWLGCRAASEEGVPVHEPADPVDPDRARESAITHPTPNSDTGCSLYLFLYGLGLDDFLVGVGKNLDLGSLGRDGRLLGDELGENTGAFGSRCYCLH